jgi:ABC-type dipeptide/oligopeptide/nickel transport system permease subunit
MSIWGAMLSDGKLNVYNAPWMATFPGIAISLTILGYNPLGDGLRDVLDPRLQRNGLHHPQPRQNWIEKE